MAATRGRSLLPASTHGIPPARNMAVTIVVTVVLPSVPVMAAMGRSSQAAARSNSVNTGVADSATMANTGW